MLKCKRCQCPKRAFLISTQRGTRQGCRHAKWCQCPKRAFLISTFPAKIYAPKVTACQCPKRAFLISTGTFFAESIKGNNGVNALSGLFSFLRKISTPITPHGVVCQCPKRAFLISTVPSGNPCKHWLSSLIFAGICQTILKTVVFLQFFGLFIICSYFFVLICSFHTPHYTSIISN